MMNTLKIMRWNANGLLNHKNELLSILNLKKIDVSVISETHLTSQTFVKFKNYDVYCANHPSNNARGGSAIIVNQRIEHFEDNKLCTTSFQAVSITVKTKANVLSLTAVYCPPKHAIKCLQYKDLIQTHNNKFIMGGDFNAKHTH